MSESQRLPPYAKHATPLEGWMWVYCGQRAWRILTQPIDTPANCEVIYPADKPPSSYRWPVRDLIVGVQGLDAPMKSVGQLVLELLRCGATDVYLFDPRIVEEGKTCQRYTRKEYLEAVATQAQRKHA